MIQIAIFNNKGGVGKTTYLFHIANLLADAGIYTLMVDCDSQCSSSDGLKGSHISKARNSKQLYQDIINEIQRILQWMYLLLIA